MTRRIALIAALPALLTSCLLDQYNPSAIEGDDSGPYIEGDADTDADTDSDTDADVNIDIASVTPDYATTRGGVEITIVGGPFGTGATVLIGDTQATVSNAQETVIQAIVPSMSETGVLDLEVRTDDGLGRLDDGFTVIEDGTGLTGAIGEFYWIDYKGEYWNPAPPDDAGGAWFGFIEPASGFDAWMIYGGGTNGCYSDYTYSGPSLTPIDLSVSQLSLTAGGKTVDFSWNNSSADYETELTNSNQFATNADYTLSPLVPQNGWPDFGTPDFLYMPAGLTLTQPLIDDQYLPFYSGSQQFRWTGGNGGDYVIILLQLLTTDQSAAEEVLTCIVPNTGSYTVSQSSWNNYIRERIMVVMVGSMASSGGGTLDPNNADVSVAGSNFVYGGAYTQ